jgi:2-polyprenyl-3-methyl-5-hydroxy-6-metoxy-1,4-benzoquinol methylase
VISYHQQTLGSPNPLARFAHHSRLARARHLLATRTGVRRVLDYGCGSGEFLACLSGTAGLEAIGYEPFMQERAADGLPIHASLEAVTALAPFDVVTVLETVEHLSDEEMLVLLRQADGLLAPGGSLLFSAPIEIGPALLLKHLNRARRQRRWSGSLPIGQLLAASILGIPPPRAVDIKTSHQGFDFRQALRVLQDHFAPVLLAGYSPLPLGTWYGNSQVFFWLQRDPQRQLSSC